MTRPDFAVNVTHAVQTGLPTRKLLLRMLLPGGLVVVLAVVLAFFWARERIETSAWAGLEATVQTVFDSHSAVQGSGNGLSALVRRSGLERIWVVDATGKVVASSMPRDVGAPLDPYWWRAVKDMQTGSLVTSMPYGASMVAVVAIRDASLGRWAVAVGPEPPVASQAIRAGLAILGVSLTMWILIALAMWYGVIVRLHGPLDALDSGMMSVLRGETPSTATLDMLQARTEPMLGGHAACSTDLLRTALSHARRADRSEAATQGLLDALPVHAMVVRRDGTVLARNSRVPDGGGPARILSDLSTHMPVTEIRTWLDRVGPSKAGAERVLLQDGRLLTVQPVLWAGEPACLVLVEARPDAEGVEPGAGNHPSAGSHPEREDWDALIQGAGLQAVVFNEDGDCLYTTPGMDAADLRAFRRDVLADDASRNAFDAWMQERPDTRAQRLNMASVGEVDWHAREISWRGTDAGLLWAVAEREHTFN
ncbi:MAG: PDC sensor domain-containing protein [Rhodothermales bacterium]